MTPSPPPDANGNGTNNTRGLINLVAQTFAGVKTFLNVIIASAGIQLATVFNTNGTGSTDVCVTIGTNVADGSVNATAKLASFGTGIGGTYVEKLAMLKSGQLVGDGGWKSSLGSSIFSLNEGFIKGLRGASAFSLNEAGGGSAQLYNTGTGIEVKANILDIYGPATRIWRLSAAAGDRICGFGVGATDFAKILESGQISQSGTDSTGTPGASTINKPIGKSSIAAGASSCVVTNSLATAAMHCVAFPHARDATGKELIGVCGAGTITFSTSANCTAALPFSWELKGLL